MFEVRLQTYWSDVDAAGIVYFPHFFKFAEHAEEEMFRAAGKELQSELKAHHMWLPRVEAFSKFSKPIRLGTAIRVRLTPQLKGEKTIRYDFEIIDDVTAEKLASGYVTVVCVDAATFKSTRIPDAIRNIVAQHA
jgi:YbgC/YbaW family acyl-CoA thioester hydrolase